MLTPILLQVCRIFGYHFVHLNIATHEKEFIEAVKNAIATGQIIRTQITPDNLKQVFDQWIEMIGKEIGGVADEDYALLFFADAMSDGTVSTHDDLTAQLVPEALQKIIAEAKEGKKKILVLINPPYAESGQGIAKGNKDNVAKTKFGKIGMEEYLGGFIVHSKAFDGLKGDFPIGFCIWKTNNCHTDLESANAASLKEKSLDFSNPCDNKNNFPTEIQCDMLDKNAVPIGSKTFFNLPNDQFLSKWIKRPRANQQEVIPLKNAIVPTPGLVRVSKWSDGAIAYMLCGKNDLQHAGQQTVLFSSPYGNGDGFYVTKENLWQAAVVFTVRRIVQHTWINDRDQFLQPTADLPQEFIDDCLIWMLFQISEQPTKRSQKNFALVFRVTTFYGSGCRRLPTPFLLQVCQIFGYFQ